MGFQGFELDFRNIIVLFSLSIHASLLWLIYRYGKDKLSGRSYAVAILAIVGWVFPMALYRAHLFGEVLIWARLLYMMASFTSTTFFLFTLTFPEDKKPPIWLQVSVLLENLFIVYLCWHPTWMIKAVEIVDKGEDILIWGPLYTIYSNHISLFFLAGFVVLFLKWRKAQGLTKRQIIYILGGYFFASNLAMATNLILPWIGYFELNWMGQFFSTIVAAFTTYAIFRLQLMNIKVIATEGFLIVLNLFLFVRLLIFDNFRDLGVNGVVFLSVLTVSYLLILTVRKEVERREEVTKLAHSLEKANLKLKELDRQKTEFLSIASHQLRTPLSIMKGYIELIEDGAFGKPTTKTVEILGEMDESNERLVKLIDEFLDITRIEQGRTKFNFSVSDLTKLIDSVVKELKDRAGNKGLKIVWKNHLKKADINMDEEKVRHVVFNYIDNAIKYTEKGNINVELKKENEGLAVRVKDHGIGFGKDDESNFFQKFYRGNNVKGSNVTGTGLGIFVCKKFIESHGGRVWAHSEGMGKGSEFGFWLPVKFSVPAELIKDSKQQVVINQYKS